MSERRYTEQEFAAILAESVLAQATTAPGSALRPRQGLSLSEIQAIAAEVGVDASVIARAARSLPVESESETARLLGGPERIQLEFSLDRPADPATLDRVLEAVRRATGQQGTAARTDSTLEWSSKELTQFGVNVTAGDGESRVMILVDRGGAAGLTVLFAALGAFTTFGVGGAILEPTGVVAIGGLALGIGATAALTARTLWSRATRRCRALLARVSAAVAEAIERPGSARP